MNIILAVSGGVDSVAMLHSLALQDGFIKLKFSKVKYVVAHFDHGMRSDSSADARFVESLAYKYGLKYEGGRANLGKNANEAVARKARWEFLRQAQRKYDAGYIATAHHSDDVFETQIINLLRGTGRRGVSVLRDKNGITRPLITKTKSEIYDYAVRNRLEFVEDSTNLDTRYLRNRLRRNVIPHLIDAQKFKRYFANINLLNDEIDDLLSDLTNNVSRISSDKVIADRKKFNNLPPQIRRELVLCFIDALNVLHAKQIISAGTLDRVVEFASRPDSNRYLHMSKLLQAYISKQELIIEKRK